MSVTQAELEKKLAELIEVHNVPGAQLAVLDGDTITEVAAGVLSIRTGSPVTTALDALARRSGLPVVSRFAEGMAVAIERGTPLAGVLHAQATDVREAGRRALIEAGARKEILMMVANATDSLSWVDHYPSNVLLLHWGRCGLS